MIAALPPLDEAAIREIFAAQRRRSRDEPSPTLAERRASLDRLAHAIRRRRREIADALWADFRKCRDEAELSEILFVLNEIKTARANLARWMTPKRVRGDLTTFGSTAELRYEPRGVACILAPWNYPFQLAIGPLVAALSAGCRVIVRPSEKAPHTRDVIERLIAETFAPHDVAMVGGEVQTAQALVRLPFDHIFFTGSTAVGKLVMHAAAEHLASVTLELGGKSPCIVTANANISHAAKRIAWGKFLNAGQTCVAPDYVIADTTVHDRLIAELRRVIVSMYGASEHDRRRSPDFSRIIDDAHYVRLTSVLDASVRDGAQVVIGGERDPLERYLAPTVLSGVTPRTTVMSDEIFGPILPVLRYDRLSEALREIAGRPKPLALYAFSADRAELETIIGRTSAGTTLTNDTVLQWVHPGLPAGGVGESGMGNYHGRFGFEAFSHERSTMHQTRASASGAIVPPYGLRTRFMRAFLDRLT